MRDKIVKILQEIRPEFDFNSNFDFIEEGYLDSFDIITLVNDLESEFHTKIPGEMITPENFCQIDAIMLMIQNNLKK
jgi:acyl carrier protein